MKIECNVKIDHIECTKKKIDMRFLKVAWSAANYFTYK